ncbi:hypothetical protein ACXWTF_00845 [Thiomicrolovo sp. ZZH C-3]
MIKRAVAAGLAVAAVLGLGACSKKAPDCDAEEVVAYLKHDDGVLKGFIERRYELTKVVDGGLEGNRRECSAVLTTTVTLKEDLGTIMEEAQKASKSEGVSGQLMVGSYLMGLSLLGLQKKGDTSVDESALTYTTAYTEKGESVITVTQVQ